MFVKPASVSTGIGIGRINKVHDRKQLAHIVEEITKQYPTQTVLIERFLGGREFTVGIIGTGAASYVIGVRELVFLKGNPQFPINPDCAYDTFDPDLFELDVYGHDLKHKWSQNPQYVDMDLSDDVARAAGKVALEAWKLLGCRDGGRVDIRHDKMGLGAVPNFIEVSSDSCLLYPSPVVTFTMFFFCPQVNPLAGLTPNWSDLPELAKAKGISFDRLLELIIDSALKRSSIRDHNSNA